jgi:hypothetical protein
VPINFGLPHRNKLARRTAACIIAHGHFADGLAALAKVGRFWTRSLTAVGPHNALLHWGFNRNVAGIRVAHLPHRMIKLVRERNNLIRWQPCLSIHQDRSPEGQLLRNVRRNLFLVDLTNDHDPLPWVNCPVTGISLVLERDCSKTLKWRLRGPDSTGKGISVHPVVPLEPQLALAHKCPVAHPDHFGWRSTFVVQDPPVSFGRNDKGGIRKLPQPTSLSSSGRKCFDTTNPMIRIGVARNAPIGPHNHVQNARAKKTIEGLRLRFRPTMFGVTK